MQVLVQAKQRVPMSINVFNALLGFQERGWEHEYFESIDELRTLAHPTKVVLGGGGIVDSALRILGKPAPSLPCYPHSLMPFLGRTMRRTTLGAVLAQFELGQQRLFVKPSERDRKLFTGLVLESLRDLRPLAGLPDELEVDTCDALRFMSEYRVFINRGEIVGVRHYKGDFRLSLDFAVVDAAVAAFTEAPISCGLDFGLTNDGRCLLVEVNDAYALGAYGLGSVTYSRMVEDRWLQMVGAL